MGGRKKMMKFLVYFCLILFFKPPTYCTEITVCRPESTGIVTNAQAEDAARCIHDRFENATRTTHKKAWLDLSGLNLTDARLMALMCELFRLGTPSLEDICYINLQNNPLTEESATILSILQKYCRHTILVDHCHSMINN